MFYIHYCLCHHKYGERTEPTIVPSLPSLQLLQNSQVPFYSAGSTAAPFIGYSPIVMESCPYCFMVQVFRCSCVPFVSDVDVACAGGKHWWFCGCMGERSKAVSSLCFRSGLVDGFGTLRLANGFRYLNH